MSGLFGGGGGSKSVSPVNHVSALAPPSGIDPAIQAAGAAARAAAALAAGRGSTIATSPTGDTAPAVTTKKTLLGVS